MKAFLLEPAVYMHQQCGFDITLICDHDPELESSLPEGIRFIPVPMRRGIDPRALVTVFRLWRIFRRERFDLVQYSTPNASFYASIAASLARVRVRLYAQMGVVYVSFDGFERAVFKAIEKVTCRLSTAIEAVSHSNRDFFIREGLYSAEESVVIWNGSSDGVNLEVFDVNRRPEWARQVRHEFGIAQSAFVLGYVGRITRDKGVNELMESFRVFLRECRDAYLLLVGDPESLDSLDAELLEWAQQESHVIFSGYVTDTQRYFAAMDAFVLPSYREGFGSVIIEAEAMAVPVITTDIPGPVDAVIPGVTALLVKSHDAAGLLAAIRTLYSNPELRASMGSSGRRFAAENFDHTVLMEHILQERKRLLGMS